MYKYGESQWLCTILNGEENPSTDANIVELEILSFRSKW